MTAIPDAAIEAAAEAVWRRNGHIAPNQEVGDMYRRDASAAIEAAMPAIEKQLREAIAQEIKVGTSDAKWSVTFRNGMNHAARIVQGGTP